MDTSVKAYLTSPEGQQWLIDNEETLRVVSNYISDSTDYPMGKFEINRILKMFPEFYYRGLGFRCISISKDLENSHKLSWNDTFENLAWSKRKDAYRQILSSRSQKNHLVQIYQGNIVGLDVHAFVLEFSEFYGPFKSNLGLTAYEEEVLIISFTDLEKIDEFIHE